MSCTDCAKGEKRKTLYTTRTSCRSLLIIGIDLILFFHLHVLLLRVDGTERQPEGR